MLPPNAARIGEVVSFGPVGSNEKQDGRLPPTITLKSGERLCDVDNIIICTGYHNTYPFLLQYHNDELRAAEADDEVLVTDGSQVHNLHKDIWYIPDPSLIFVGIPFFTANFTLFEFQAIAVAAVLSSGADLPDEQTMRKEYLEKLALKGCGKGFHSLRGEEVDYVKKLLEWINCDGAKRGRAKVEGHSEVWHHAQEDLKERIRKAFASNDQYVGFPLPSCS